MTEGHRRSSDAPYVVAVAALVMIAGAAAYSLIPFDRVIPVGPQREITATCGAPVVWLGRSLPDTFPSRHDRYRFVECRFEGRIRLFKAALMGGFAWFIAGVALVRSRRILARWEVGAFKGVGVVFGVGASLGAVGFAIATARNPYDDLTRAYTFVFTLGFGIAALIFWVLFAMLRTRLRSGAEAPSPKGN